MHHDLKIWPQYFAAVQDGSKTFEIRKNDRGFQKGDTVTLHEYDPNKEVETLRYTGQKLFFKVGYVYPLKIETDYEMHVIFSLLRCESEPTPS